MTLSFPFVRIGDQIINIDHVSTVEFTSDLDIKIIFDSMAEPRAGGQYLPSCDKPLTKILLKGTQGYADAVEYWDLENIISALEQAAKQAPPKKEKAKR